MKKRNIKIISIVCAVTIIMISAFCSLLDSKKENKVFAIENSSFLIGDFIESIDFVEMKTGDITESGNWQFSNAKIVEGKEQKGNVLQLVNYYGEAGLYTEISKSDFCVVAVFGTDGNNPAADGAPALQVLGVDESGEYKESIGLSFAQKNRQLNRSPNNGGTLVRNSINNYTSKIEYDEDGYTLVTAVIYAYKGKYYCYIQNEFLGEYSGADGVNTNEKCRIAVSESWSNVYLHSVSVYDIMPIDLSVNDASFVAEEKIGLNVSVTVDNTNTDVFKNVEYGAVVTFENGSTPQDRTVKTEGADIIKLKVSKKAEVNNLSIFTEISKENADKHVNVRPFACRNGVYSYGEAKTYSTATLATVVYEKASTEKRERIMEFFKDSKEFVGDNVKKITFTAFADFHYMKNLETEIICRSNVSDLVSILKRGEESGSAFVMQLGDLVKDAKVSKEIFDTYLNYKKQNGELMKVYGIYGNHDIEQSNKMSYVNTTLTNDKNTVWGTQSKKMEIDSRIAYYYVDYDSFRFIYLDNNYSYNAEKDIWERNRDGSWSYPSGNTKGYSLGPVQQEWLKNVLTDAGEKNMTCVVASHAAIHPKLNFSGGGDAKETLSLLLEINEKYPGTVVLALNGHSHTNELIEADGIVWLAVNNTFANFGGADTNMKISGIYGDLTVKKEMYDNQGNFIEVRDYPMNKLQFNDITFFSQDPLSAVITIDNSGRVVIEGTESNWAYNINPTQEFMNSFKESLRGVYQPRISSYSNYKTEE